MDSFYREQKIREDKYKKSLKKAITKGEKEKLNMIKSEYSSVKPIDKERTLYINESEYLKRLNEKIINLEKKRISQYYDIFYDLQDSMDEYDRYKVEIDKLKRKYMTQLKIKTDREEGKRVEKEKLKNQLNENIIMYKFMDINDKKDTYLKIREIGKKLLEKNINIIPTMEDGKQVYRSMINYDPVIDIKI